MGVKLLTQVYALRAGRVLLLKGKEGPDRSLWIAPAGEVDPGESPHEGALRALREETGLQANALLLRGIVTHVLQETGDTSVHFIYATNDFSGELSSEDRRSGLTWQHLHRVNDLPMPESNAKFFPFAVNLNSPIYQGKYVYNTGRKLIETVEY